MRRYVFLSGVLAVVLARVCPASAAVATYTNRTQWNTAVGGDPTWLVDFHQFKDDTPFNTSAVDCGPFSLVQIGAGDFRNLIDVKPFLYLDGSTSKHASMFTDYGKVAVQMTFDQPVYAWGANFYSLDAEWVKLDLVLDLGGVLATVSPSKASGFFGVVASDPHTAIRSILFESRDSLPDGGEGFGMDNVAGEQTIPEPASLAIWSLLGGVGVAVAWRRRRAG